MVVSSEDCKLVEPKKRSRTLELRSFSCPNLMHDFDLRFEFSNFLFGPVLPGVVDGALR
jgi:hypothetical protein